MIIMTIIAMVLFFKVIGFLFRIGWKIASWIFGIVGFLILAGLVISVVGYVLLPIIGIVALVVLISRDVKKEGGAL